MGAKVAIIPARSGSKRIPNKNIKDFFGKPVIAHAIENTLRSGVFDEVMVSTDDDQIAEIASAFGAKIPFLRSKENASDIASTTDVLLEVLEYYGKNRQYFKWGCCIYPVTPLLTPNLFKEAFDQMSAQECTSIFTVQAFSHPIHRAMRIDQYGKIQMMNKDQVFVRTQDIPISYHDAGQFYWFEVEKFKREKSIISTDTSGFIVDEFQAQDVDTLADWTMMEVKYQHIKSILK
ncbi:MAG: pseudaminic acid cytidylyltransferase [Flavobacteriaceae bacterium]